MDITRRNRMASTRKLGTTQEAVLRCLLRYGGSWGAGAGGWVWGTYSETVRVLESLERRGLVTRHEVPWAHTRTRPRWDVNRDKANEALRLAPNVRRDV